MAITLQRGTFGLDQVADGFGHYPGYWNGRHTRGGGWACPMFERAAADAIMAEQNRAHPDSIRYDEVTDCYITSEDDRFESFEVTIEGRRLHLYDFGGWCWDTV